MYKIEGAGHGGAAMNPAALRKAFEFLESELNAQTVPLPSS